jgi:DNA-binding beta-propeller fold protein YncE
MLLLSKLRLFLLVTALASWSVPGYALTLSEGWTIEYEVDFENAQAARLNPFDNMLYVAEFSGSGGVYRVDPTNGNSTLLANAFNPRGLVIDPADGDVFYAEGGQPGEIFRVPFGQVGVGSQLWASGFHGNLDSDPIGMAIAPMGYVGPSFLAPGEGLFADEGFGGPQEIWRWDPATFNEQELIVGDDDTIVKPVDVAIGSDAIYLVDQSLFTVELGVLLRIEADQSVTEIVLDDALTSPMGVAVDPLTGDVIVADAKEQTIFRVDPLTGDTTVLAYGFEFGNNIEGPKTEASSLGFSLLGDRLVVTQRGNTNPDLGPLRPGKVYVLSMVPEPHVVVLLGLGLAALGRARRRSRDA